MHGTTVEKARTDSHQVGSSCDPDLIPASLTPSTLRAVSMARPTANLRPATGGGGVGGSNGAAAASAAQLNFYEELCNRQLYRSSLHNLLTSCGGSGSSPAGSMNTGLPLVEARCHTLGRYPVAHGSSAELQRHAASMAALATGRPETQACAMSASVATGASSPPRWSHAPHSAVRAGSTEAAHTLPQHSGLPPALEGTPSLPFGQLPPPPAAAVATAAAAGLQQRAAIHRRARSMDESASRHQKRNDAAATASGATTVSTAAASAAPAPVAQLPAAADRLHSSQAAVAEQQQQQAATAVKPRSPAAFGGAAFKRSLPDSAVLAVSTASAASASSSTPTAGVVTAGAQKVVLRKSLSSSIGDRGRSLSCTPSDEKECCLPPPLLPPPPPPAMAASSSAVGGSSSFGEGTAGGSAAAVAKTQVATAAAVAAAAHANQGAAARTSAAAHSAARQRHAMHVDDSNYVVMSPIHVRSSSGIVEGCANRTSASSSLSGDSRHSARSLEELSAGGSTQPLLSEPPHSGDRGTAVARGSASGSRAFHPGSGPQPAPLLPCSASGDATDRRVGSASNATVQAAGGAGYADNTYENVYRNGMPLCEPVVYANVSSIIRSRAVLPSATKADLTPATNEGRCVLPQSLPPPPATETHHRCCTPPAGASPSSAADGAPATQSTMASSGSLRSGSSTAAGHGEPVLSPTSSVASGSSVFARMPSSCSVSNSSINSCVAAVERETLAYTSSCESHSPGAASSPTEDGERPGSRGAPLYVNVQECLLPSCMPPPAGGCGGSRSSPRPASPLPELNYAELMHTAPPAMVASSTGGGGSSSSGGSGRKRQSPCHPPTTLLRGISSGSGTGAKVDSSSDSVLYAEINIAATEAAHKAQVHQTRYRQEQRNGLRADGGGGGSSAQPTTAGMADR